MFTMEQTKRYQKSKVKPVSMTVVNPNAAGVDIGDTIHAAAVPGDRVQTPVRTFGTMSCDLDGIADWLQECHIDTVAMEPTGVYWKPIFGLLIRRGIEVFWSTLITYAMLLAVKPTLSPAVQTSKTHYVSTLFLDISLSTRYV
jgi:hypothetical protein